jgi:hypothetical protein
MRMIFRRSIPIALIAVLCGWVPGYGRGGEFHGLLFGDFYWVAASHDPSLEDRNGFWIRRIYLTYDPDLGGEFSARIRMEMASPGDFASSSRIEPFIKDAWLRWKRSGHEVIFGLSPTPTFARVEPAWGYRAVEKTPLDLQKYGSTRDFGVAVRGRLGRAGRVYYHAMLANGSGTGTETDEGKKVYGALGFRPDERVILEFNADLEDRGGPNRHTLQGFAVWKDEDRRAGVIYARQTQAESGHPDVTREVLSLFGVARVSDRLHVFGRLDHNFDPAPSGIAYLPFDPSAESSNLIVAGIDLSPAKDVHVIPNIEVVIYGDAADGTSPDPDVMPRVTVYYRFD